jgi:hypothetical protein
MRRITVTEGLEARGVGIENTCPTITAHYVTGCIDDSLMIAG